MFLNWERGWLPITQPLALPRPQSRLSISMNSRPRGRPSKWLSSNLPHSNPLTPGGYSVHKELVVVWFEINSIPWHLLIHQFLQVLEKLSIDRIDSRDNNQHVFKPIISVSNLIVNMLENNNHNKDTQSISNLEIYSISSQVTKSICLRIAETWASITFQGPYHLN
jgi:hypothetical protein